MKIGAFGVRADHGGLSTQTREFVRHMEPEKVAAIDLGRLGRGPVHKDIYPDAEWFEGYESLTDARVDAWLKGLDVVFCCETPYREDLFERARRQGVVSVLQANPELYRSDHARPDHIWHPTHWQAVKGSSVLPVPVARDRLPFRLREQVKTFVHISATAMKDRDGLRVILGAIRYMRKPCRLIVVGNPRIGVSSVSRCRVEIRRQGYRDYWGLWPSQGDVLLIPRRYGGLCLVMQEAASLGMPIITTDLEPQRSFLPAEGLIGAGRPQPTPMVGGTFDVFSPGHRELAEKMKQVMGDPELTKKLSDASDRWAESISWSRMAEVYRTELEQVCR